MYSCNDWFNRELQDCFSLEFPSSEKWLFLHLIALTVDILTMKCSLPGGYKITDAKSHSQFNRKRQSIFFSMRVTD